MSPTRLCLSLLVTGLAHARAACPDWFDPSGCQEPEECEGGTVPDFADCCKACALIEGDPCRMNGVLVGTCDKGLKCEDKSPGFCVKESGWIATIVCWSTFFIICF